MDTQKHVVAKMELLQLSANDGISVLNSHMLSMEWTLTETLHFILHVISLIKGSFVGRELMKKVRDRLMSAFWKVKIESALKIYPR